MADSESHSGLQAPLLPALGIRTSPYHGSVAFCDSEASVRETPDSTAVPCRTHVGAPGSQVMAHQKSAMRAQPSLGDGLVAARRRSSLVEARRSSLVGSMPSEGQHNKRVLFISKEPSGWSELSSDDEKSPDGQVSVVRVGNEWSGCDSSSSNDEGRRVQQKQRPPRHRRVIGDETSSSDDDGPRWQHQKARRSVGQKERRRSSAGVDKQDVGIILDKSRDWGAMGQTQEDSWDAPGGLDRRERYARFAKELEKEARAHTEAPQAIQDEERPQTLVPGADGCSRTSLGMMCCLGCLLHNALHVRLFIMVVEMREIPLVCSLAVPAAFLAAIEAFLARTDRSILAAHYRLLRNTSGLKTAAFDFFVILCLGCLYGYRLLRAFRYWTGCTSGQGTFISELELRCPSKCVTVWHRQDSYYLLWGVPTAACLTLALALGNLDEPFEVTFWLTILVFAAGSAIASVVHFDRSVSSNVRAWQGWEFDGLNWSRPGEKTILPKLVLLHWLCRTCEMTGRLLWMFVISAALASHLWLLGTVLGSHCVASWALLCMFAGPSGSSVFAVVPLLLIDTARYIDEPGFALPGRKLSQRLWALHTLEFVVALALCVLSCFESTTFSLNTTLALPALVLLVLTHAMPHVLRRHFLEFGELRDDLFTATLRGDVQAMEESLSLAGGCSVNMRVCDTSGRTALHFAADHNDVGAITFLLAEGATSTVVDVHEDNPLHVAVRRGHLQAAQALLQVSNGGESSSQDRKIVTKLIRQMNTSGETPEDIIPKRSPAELRQLLEKASTDASEQSISDRSPASSRTSSARNSGVAAGVQCVRSLFGSILSPVQAGPIVGLMPEEAQRSNLATFMLSRGVGEQLQRLREWLRHSRRRTSFGLDRRVHLSDLRIVSTLGAGGFGKVLKVEDMRSGAFFALKLQCRSKAMKQAVREAQALDRSQHPFIVELMQIFRTYEYYGLIMEFCDKDLNVRILQHENSTGSVEGLPANIAARYTVCVMLALEYLHSNSIIFRDLKPENVLIVEREDHAKLADFGLARSFKPEECEDGDQMKAQITMAAGTHAFMSSEAFDGGPGDIEVENCFLWFAARDWYGLGCCLLLMLLGEGGGRKLYASTRVVLLPAKQEQIPELLERAKAENRLDEDSFQLLASLTSETVEERSDSQALRGSALLRDSLEELEDIVAAFNEQQSRPQSTRSFTLQSFVSSRAVSDASEDKPPRSWSSRTMSFESLFGNSGNSS
mmetsp:Transcript_97998/g.189203  ORF Transcript_97998/g.189203 Transcript_97998/m.189203 type:complete len:1237 (+) Transcript_97998:43-3753(+)